MLFRLQSFGSVEEALIYLLCLVLGVFVAISFHEWAHAWVAWKLGDPTAKNMGRMSLDPTKHLDLMGTLAFVLLGLGWAKPVMVNSRNLKHFRRDDILISISGPVMNLLLSFVFYGLLFFSTVKWGWSEASGVYPVLVQIFSVICSLNISFAIFNVLPIPPLDGFHVVTSLFIRKNYNVVAFLQRYGFIILLVLLVTGVIGTVMSWVYTGLSSLYFNFFMLFI